MQNNLARQLSYSVADFCLYSVNLYAMFGFVSHFYLNLMQSFVLYGAPDACDIYDLS